MRILPRERYLAVFSMGLSPHRGDDRTSTGEGELPHRLESNTGVPSVVGGVRRFQIGGKPVDINQCKVMFQKRHPDPLATVARMRSQETQVVVGLVTGVRSIEARK